MRPLAGAVWAIARQEFVRVLTYPLIPVVAFIVFLIALLDGAGYASGLEGVGISNGPDVLIFGFTRSWESTAMICSIVAIFLGATSILYERWNSSLNVLLTKPLYRRDYYMGKFLGLSGFMLLFNAFTILLVGLMMVVFYMEPQSGSEFALRVSSYIFITTLSCSLVLALSMFFGVLSKNILLVTSLSVIYTFFDWIWHPERIMGGLSEFTPQQLYFRLIGPKGITDPAALFNTLVPFDRWLNAAIPLLIFVLLEMLALLLIGMCLFSREDSV
ncbi:ABC transporter permease [Methanocella conradii]|uniref:ABC transporter permease n=1 Tax=Methanocella conradii TaxID=1175444 RepID=UPI0024B38D9D|nr:ABC transporter permease subunit [Methanocella conradii]MDI6897782.1 ABC transporter permease subunit [Methanocella conradii]